MPQPLPPAPTLHSQLGWGWWLFTVAAALTVVGVPAVSLVASFVAPREGWYGLLAVAGAALLGGLNAYLSWVRFPLYCWRHGSREGYRFVSGIPILGSVSGTLGTAAGWGDWRAAVLALVAAVIDPGGLPWFLIAMIRMRQI